MGQTKTVALGKRDNMSGIAIGMTVIGCLVAVSVIAGVLWLRWSTRRRPSQVTDVELLRKPRDWYAARPPRQAPAPSRYGQPGMMQNSQNSQRPIKLAAATNNGWNSEKRGRRNRRSI
jgi:hypothetical protein